MRYINVHRSALAQEQNRAIARDEAVASWYDTVYLVGMQVIREQNMLKSFSNRTEADLYRWMVEQEMMTTSAPVSYGSHNELSVSQASMGRKQWVDALVGIVRRAIQRLRRWP